MLEATKAAKEQRYFRATLGLTMPKQHRLSKSKPFFLKLGVVLLGCRLSDRTLGVLKMDPLPLFAFPFFPGKPKDHQPPSQVPYIEHLNGIAGGFLDLPLPVF